MQNYTPRRKPEKLIPTGCYVVQCQAASGLVYIDVHYSGFSEGNRVIYGKCLSELGCGCSHVCLFVFSAVLLCSFGCLGKILLLREYLWLRLLCWIYWEKRDTSANGQGQQEATLTTEQFSFEERWLIADEWVWFGCVCGRNCDSPAFSEPSCFSFVLSFTVWFSSRQRRKLFTNLLKKI